MFKHPIPLFVSFALGALLSALVGRGLGFARPEAPGTAVSPVASAAAAVAPPSLPSNLVAEGALVDGAAATPETSVEPSQWLAEWVARGAPVEQRSEAMRMVARWAEADARSALEFVANAARFPERLDAVVVCLAKRGEQDVAFVVTWMTTHLTLDERVETVGSVARRLSEANPALALELAFAPNLPVDRGTFAFLIAALARIQPAQAVASFGKLSEEGRLQVAESLAGAWYETDRDAAVHWCAAQRTSAHGRAALRGLIEAVATTAPDQLAGIINRLAVTPEEMATMQFDLFMPDTALALLPHLPEKGRYDAVTEIVREELQRDPVLALKLARDSLSPDASRAVIKEAWEWWQRSDGKAAHDWATGLDDPALKLALLGEPVDPLLKMDPARFLAEADRTGYGAKKPEHLNQAIYDVANEDPRAAAGWIDRMVDTVAPPTVREVATSWLERDEQAAWAWISSLGTSVTRDAAVSAAVGHWVDRGQVPQATAALAAIVDPRSQTAMRWSVLRDLHRRDPAAALLWIEAQPMNNEVRESWVTILESHSAGR